MEPHCSTDRRDRSWLPRSILAQLSQSQLLGMAVVELYDDSTFGRKQEEATSGGVSPVFVDVVPESCLVCGPGFVDVEPVIAELSDPDFACWRGGRCGENPTCCWVCC
jgi:hypothetical protein